MIRRASLLSVLLLASTLGGAGIAQAQARLDTQLFRPPATSGGVLDLDAATVGPHLTVAGSLFLGYAHDPLVLRGLATNAPLGSVVRHQFDGQLAISFALWRRLELGLLLPVVLYQTGPAALFGGLSKTALGDLRFEAKVRLHTFVPSHAHQVSLALAASLGIPTGNDNAFYADDSFTFRPRFMMTYLFRDRFHLTVQIGAVIRAARAVADLLIQHQLSYGLAARVRLVRGFSLSATFAGLAGLNGTRSVAGAPMEILAGPEYRFARLPFELLAAAGGGLTNGLGAPDARVIAAVRYQPREAPDRDGDGTIDRLDHCPDEPGPKENAGCPDKDTDGDGIIDRLDRCPEQAGPVETGGCPDKDTDGDGVVDRLDSCPTLAGPKENGGCPEKDQDKDGVADRIDKCPEIPGPAENNGCPWPDRDGDGVLDKVDRCPEVYGLKENDGCPDVDSDGDGIPDRLDKCPLEAEIFNGVEDEDGCPDKGRALAVITANAIEIKEQIFFEFAKSDIKPRSFLLLATVAKIMTLHPDITKIRVDGHTDTVGKRDYNIALSRARAQAVKDHLVNVNGIDASRLESEGHGPDLPIANNTSAAGRAKNRRVEFNLIERIDLATGKPKAVARPAKP